MLQLPRQLYCHISPTHRHALSLYFRWNELKSTLRMGIEDSVQCGWSADKIHVFDAQTGVGFAYREKKAA